MYTQDNRIVMTLDAGGTNMVFSAIQANREVVEPISIPTVTDHLPRCLQNIRLGFERVLEALHGATPVAISFAFPGPADYTNGVIGDLPNFPAFRHGVALGPYLEETFGIPVYINNDGSLYAYGEAVAGLLPEVNERLQQAGSNKQYRSLLGVTLGTGFGGGVVINNQLHRGDNENGGYVWMMRNKKHPHLIVEESVSIRAIRRVYAELSGQESAHLTPKDIFEIAEGTLSGNREAAQESFAQLGEMAGDAIAHALAMVDGLVVVGGGLSGAAKYIFPALLRSMREKRGTFANDLFPAICAEVYHLDEAAEWNQFAAIRAHQVRVPFSERMVNYQPDKAIGIALSRIGASRAIALGAYAFALHSLDSPR